MAYQGNLKYFILTNEEKNPLLQIMNINQSIDVRKLNRKEYQTIPSYVLLNAKLGIDGIFPDIIEKPVFLLSRAAMEVTGLYDSNIPFLFFVLFDTDKGECASYFSPVLEEEDCLAQKPGPGQRELILDRSKMRGTPLFRVRVGAENMIVIRMDLAESLLERNIIGLELKEICLIDGAFNRV